MEEYCTHPVVCQICTKEPEDSNSSNFKVSKMSTSRHLLLLSMAIIVYIADVAKAFGPPETLCGGELVDTLQFVCGDRGFYFSRPTGRSTKRPNRGIVEECCFRSCDLALLETYCAKAVKTERDLTSSSLQVLPAVNKDVFRKTSIARYSKYDWWQRKPAQRLRRGLPSIARAGKLRRLARARRPLIARPSRHPFTARARPQRYPRRE
ncbi:insulin-like growth factor 2b [Latimeria chalumnae]|uniref:Insulin-like growth factor 2 n=1 Tax=Latimeria chalumnae TaxID=7897 RepID=H3A5N5_LATCH|nr:PREDICTED: insulin-like growth factor II [Latimeria chalumnae]|eukprot:XP_006008146.1 PREDICTED: insulin-like growth factor II [Latimeria chalumnae]